MFKLQQCFLAVLFILDKQVVGSHTVFADLTRYLLSLLSLCNLGKLVIHSLAVGKHGVRFFCCWGFLPVEICTMKSLTLNVYECAFYQPKNPSIKWILQVLLAGMF